MSRIPIYILTGYLGAGKTTTLNHLLKTPHLKDKKLALIINEFGKIGIDGKLVDPGDYEKFEINKGSIFCICTKTDFLKALDGIVNEIKPDAVIIEATGIAETSDIESFVKENQFEDDLEVKANICIVDAQNFTKTAPFLKPVKNQVLWADGIIINKTDLVDENEIETLKKVLKDLNPEAKVTDAVMGNIAVDFVSSLQHKSRDKKLIEEPPEDIIAVSVKKDEKMIHDKFKQAVDYLGEKLLRLKGNIVFDDKKAYVEKAGGQYFEKPLNSEIDKNTAFTVIVWKISKEELTSLFDDCVA